MVGEEKERKRGEGQGRERKKRASECASVLENSLVFFLEEH